jgi:hypothetical protein
VSLRGSRRSETAKKKKPKKNVKIKRGAGEEEWEEEGAFKAKQ